MEKENYLAMERLDCAMAKVMRKIETCLGHQGKLYLECSEDWGQSYFWCGGDDATAARSSMVLMRLALVNPHYTYLQKGP